MIWLTGWEKGVGKGEIGGGTGGDMIELCIQGKVGGDGGREYLMNNICQFCLNHYRSHLL